MHKKVMTEHQMRAPSHSLQRLMSLSGDSVQQLANAIICVAADDYRRGMKNKDKKLIREVEEFFHSDWFSELSDADPDYILKALREECKTLRVGQK